MSAGGGRLQTTLGDLPAFKDFVERAQSAQQAVDQAIAQAAPAETPPASPSTERDQQDMGKEEAPAAKSPREYTTVEKRAVLEATRGLGEKALKEHAEKLGIGRTTIYTWRKELWGTMNAYGIADSPRARSRKNDDGGGESGAPAPAKPPPVVEGRRRRFSEQERRAHVKAANAYPSDGEYERTQGLNHHLTSWRKLFKMPRPGGRPSPAAIAKSEYTEEQRQRMARAAAASGNVSQWARESRIDPATVHTWVKRYVGGAKEARATKERAPVERPKGKALMGKALIRRAAARVTDTELINGYDHERALARTAREPAQKLLEENKRLKKLIVVLKANLAYAIENGLVEHLTIDLMFGGGKEHG